MINPTLKTTKGEDGLKYYVISSYEDMHMFRNLVFKANGCTRNGLLTADIDMQEEAANHYNLYNTSAKEKPFQKLNPKFKKDRAIYQHWKPIGADSLSLYQGVFDGQGHTIKGLYVDSIALDDYAGLFGQLKSGIIKNIVLDSPYVHGDKSSGCIAGIVYEKGSIQNCTVKNIVNISGLNTGGIAGENTGNIAECTVESKGKFLGNWTAGGIVGSNHGTISHCLSRTAPNSSIKSKWQAGGIAGTNGGKLISCKSYSSVLSKAYAGGMTGDSLKLSYTPDDAIFGCENYGMVHGDLRTGGLAGMLRSSMSNSRNFTEGLPDYGMKANNIMYLPYDADEELSKDDPSCMDELSW